MIQASETGTIQSSKVFGGGGMLKAELFETVLLRNGRYQVVPKLGVALAKAR